jgi:hypothetical protein
MAACYPDHTWKEVEFYVEINTKDSFPADPEFGWSEEEFTLEAECQFLIKTFNDDNLKGVSFVRVLDFDNDNLLPEIEDD